jgi:hypothetical protein
VKKIGYEIAEFVHSIVNDTAVTKNETNTPHILCVKVIDIL